MGRYTGKTPDGMARRRSNADFGYGRHRPGLQFNPANGEPHTAKWLAAMRKLGMRRAR